MAPRFGTPCFEFLISERIDHANQTVCLSGGHRVRVLDFCIRARHGFYYSAVRDSSGGVLPAATVRVSNASRRIDRISPTNSSGDYLIAGLPQGIYDVAISASGFRTYQANGVALAATQKVRIDVSLTVASMPNEVVVVSGENVAQVEAQSSELAGTVGAKQISELQLNGRDFSQLAALVPGVSKSGRRRESSGDITFNINGGREENNNWEVDGGAVLDSGANNSLNVVPSLDSVTVNYRD
jgi:hypothetical protein